jgi:hypothetical protein
MIIPYELLITQVVVLPQWLRRPLLKEHEFVVVLTEFRKCWVSENAEKAIRGKKDVLTTPRIGFDVFQHWI